MTEKFKMGAVVIDVNSLDFMGKDIVSIKNFDDFAWLVGSSVVFKLNKSYYSISDAVAYVWVEK